MLMHKAISDYTAFSISTQDKSPDTLLSKEWLLTNSRGGYASSSIIGCNTRRYHGLLVGSHHPPANRIVALSNCLETLSTAHHAYSLSNFEFDGAIHPHGYSSQLEFRKDAGIHFKYQTPVAHVRKTLYLLPEADIIVIGYEFSEILEPFEFSVRPLCSMRNFHGLQQENADIFSIWNERELCVETDDPQTGQLLIHCESMHFEESSQWWKRFYYRLDRFRGQDCHEDVWSPGEFKCIVNTPMRLVLRAGLADDAQGADILNEVSFESAAEEASRHQQACLSALPSPDPASQGLALAADAFIIKRTIDDKQTSSILAGYPWFLDWGRDAFIALEGLCLTTGRYDDAWGVLDTFARAIDEGMVPNRFDDYGQPPHYNSIDASMWFVHAAFQYLHVTDDTDNFRQGLLPAVESVIEHYHKGTRFGIRADDDMLLTGGDVNTQLTWMDAKFDGIAFTPRYGKAVEVNALWYSNLCRLSAYYEKLNSETSANYKLMAEQVRNSFQISFWDDHKGHLNDCVLSDGHPDPTLRPNQIYAVSLPYSPLTREQQKSVVQVVEKQLLTPYGLRSLSPYDPRYRRFYGGPQGQRDASYHQGTVWGFLIGGFIEAYLKVNDFDPTAKRRARSYMSKLLAHFANDACIGNISEIFDGDPPHTPRGTFAQAWSVAEALRAWQLCKETD